ncbi:MAG: GNAT family N-acetyltransferase [Actinomycetota bacterium]|nr:GNAT family N-acetyltransferase [Actinomycetota bacterium]
MTLATATIMVYGSKSAEQAFDEVALLYREVYAEPPYCEGESDFQDFVTSLPRRAAQPNFRLVVAHESGTTVGFAFGHQLSPETRWWDRTLSPLEKDVTTEYTGRTFAVIELAVRQGYRRFGFGRNLHAHLIAGLDEERVTLLVRPDATAAQAAYRTWGYRPVGQIQPFPDGPVYDSMIKAL